MADRQVELSVEKARRGVEQSLAKGSLIAALSYFVNVTLS